MRCLEGAGDLGDAGEVEQADGEVGWPSPGGRRRRSRFCGSRSRRCRALDRFDATVQLSQGRGYRSLTARLRSKCPGDGRTGSTGGRHGSGSLARRSARYGVGLGRQGEPSSSGSQAPAVAFQRSVLAWTASAVTSRSSRPGHRKFVGSSVTTTTAVMLNPASSGKATVPTEFYVAARFVLSI